MGVRYFLPFLLQVIVEIYQDTGMKIGMVVQFCSSMHVISVYQSVPTVLVMSFWYHYVNIYGFIVTHASSLQSKSKGSIHNLHLVQS